LNTLRASIRPLGPVSDSLAVRLIERIQNRGRTAIEGRTSGAGPPFRRQLRFWSALFRKDGKGAPALSLRGSP
jgi:hypothetical protein